MNEVDGRMDRKWTWKDAEGYVHELWRDVGRGCGHMKWFSWQWGMGRLE